jgi:CrcB protein
VIRQIAIVAAGGAIGAVLRFGLSGWLQRLAPHFPLGTLVVNVLGCLAIGVLMTLSEESGKVSVDTRLFIAVGLLGAFTTFSTFGYETFGLLRRGETALALASVAANVLIGLGAVVAGRAIARWG